MINDTCDDNAKRRTYPEDDPGPFHSTAVPVKERAVSGRAARREELTTVRQMRSTRYRVSPYFIDANDQLDESQNGTPQFWYWVFNSLVAGPNNPIGSVYRSLCGAAWLSGDLGPGCLLASLLLPSARASLVLWDRGVVIPTDLLAIHVSFVLLSFLVLLAVSLGSITIPALLQTYQRLHFPAFVPVLLLSSTLHVRRLFRSSRSGTPNTRRQKYCRASTTRVGNPYFGTHREQLAPIDPSTDSCSLPAFRPSTHTFLFLLPSTHSIYSALSQEYSTLMWKTWRIQTQGPPFDSGSSHHDVKFRRHPASPASLPCAQAVNLGSNHLGTTTQFAINEGQYRLNLPHVEQNPLFKSHPFLQTCVNQSVITAQLTAKGQSRDCIGSMAVGPRPKPVISLSEGRDVRLTWDRAIPLLQTFSLCG
ncbi:hypothetical protein C8R44DRAFT_752423 [Mycena epipterygia]|nr:hypothetical protein C8R44DRAFT_752423 [Mycena epipterygia]